MRRITPLLILMMLFLFVASVSANQNCYQRGCADIDLAGGQGFVYSGSNQQNILDAADVSYQECQFDGSSYGPVLSDIDLNGFQDVVVMSGSDLVVYDFQCSEMDRVTVPDSFRSTPLIINSDTDIYQEIATLDGEQIRIWEWDTILNGLNQTKNMTYSAYGSAWNYFSCFRNERNNSFIQYCIATDTSIDDIYLFNFSSLTITPLLAESSEIMHTTISASTTGFISSRTSTLGTFENSYIKSGGCLYRGSGNDPNQINCDFFNTSGNLVLSIQDVLNSASGSVSSVDYQEAVIVKMGSIRRILINIYATKSGGVRNRAGGFDILGNELFDSISVTGETLNETSNWMVADYDKDGTSDACHLINLSQYNGQVFFRCYDQNFNLKVDKNMSDFVNMTTSCVLADFFPDESRLGMACEEGIFSFDPITEKVFDSNLTTTSVQYSRGALFSGSQSGSPFYVYSSSTTGKIYGNDLINESCGNGVCEDFESAFSCQTDCGYGADQTDGRCTQNVDCATSHPICHDTYCVASDNISVTCNFDSDCPYDNPFCFSNRCVKDVQVGIPTAVNTTQSSQQKVTDDSIDSTFNILLGTSPTLKFIIGIAIVIGLVALIAAETKSAIISLVVATLGLILVTVIGLIPIYVLIIFIIVAVALAVLGKQVFGSGQGG